jgi:serine/threonine protein kinase/Tfp pilus assembly protein PilF
MSSVAIPPPGSSVDSFSPESFQSQFDLKCELLRELQLDGEHGAAKSLDDVLERWPGDARQDPDLASLVYEDYQQRAHRGEEPAQEEYQKRFPEQEQSIGSVFHRQGMLRAIGGSGRLPPTLLLPKPGDELFGFHLKMELGRGAFACVYLAEQVSLRRRPVVLKVSAMQGKEPETLAQLQHTNIVPIYSFHESDASNLHAVCMPYFGGASLSRVLEEMFKADKRPTEGRQFVAALRATQSPPPEELARQATQATAGESPEPSMAPLASSPLDEMAAGGYAWVAMALVAKLAEGLQHAHRRGILHRDIKPSNILVSHEGQPMLLDFNLSEDVASVKAKIATVLGGTVAYMAPEHLQAMALRDPMLARKVDHRSDVYSLGMVLYEMLAGSKPFEQSASYSPAPHIMEAMAVERSKGAPSLKAARPDVSWGLESVLRRCLAPDPAKRYQSAEQLATDLHALIDDRPLVHAPELSRRERLQKWARRHPRLASSGAVASVALVGIAALGLLLGNAWNGWRDAQRHVDVAAAQQMHRQFDQDTLRALCLVNTTSDLKELDHLRQGLRLCEDSLNRYGVLDRDDWQRSPNWALLDADERCRSAENVRELLLLLAGANARLHPNDAAATSRSLAWVDKADRIDGLTATAALHEERATHLAALGRAHDAAAERLRASQTPRRTARDHYLWATALVRKEGATSAAALQALDEAVRLNPRHYWSWVQRGACQLERGEAILAAGDFGVGIGLWPEFALGYFHRGCALAKAHRFAEAIADYSAALERDPDLTLAHLNRGLAHLETKAYADALRDFDLALERGFDSAPLHAGRGVALESLERFEEADAAFRLAFTRLPQADDQTQARIRCAHGFAVSRRRPADARASFNAVLAKQREQPQALYGLAMLEATQHRVDEAVVWFDRALEADPDFVEARRFRAVLLARGGSITKATEDINVCLAREPSSGATNYAAACVAAHAMNHASPANAVKTSAQAITFLERAFRLGYGRKLAATDDDLASLRQDPAFDRLFAPAPP